MTAEEQAEIAAGRSTSHGRLCPHCGVYARGTLVICPTCDGTLPWVIPSERFTSGRPRRRLWSRAGGR